jgi:hypothetical protein
MKKIIFMLLAVAALTNCSKFEPVNGDESGSQVKLTGSIYTGEETRGSGVITGTLPASTLDFSLLRADQSGSTPTYPSTYTDPDVIGTLDDAGQITTDPTALYYLADANQSSAFIGLYPKLDIAGSLSGGVVSYTPLDGSTDIMVTGYAAGNAATASTALNLTFHHLLSKVEVVVQAASTGVDPAQISAAWGKVTSIEIKDRKENVAVTLPAPGVSGHGTISSLATVGDLPLTTPTGGTPAHLEIPDDGSPSTSFGVAMFAPFTYEGTDKLKLLIATDLHSAAIEVESDDTGLVFAEGNEYTITVEFTANGAYIKSVKFGTSSEIHDWINPGSNNYPGTL